MVGRPMSGREIPSIDFRVRAPEDPKRWGIGIVGAGFIVRACHLVAYRQAGFRVVAITSRTLPQAQAVAQEFGIPRVYPSVGALAADPEVTVLDVAVPPDAQPAVIEAALASPHRLKAILAQKPLAMDPVTAVRTVAHCQGAGVVLAVNQNMRYDPSVRALKSLLDQGYLGEPVLATIEMRAIPHWRPWAQRLRSLTTYIMSIHHLDTFRFWFGDPVRVMASARPDPRTSFPHRDGVNLYVLEYPTLLRACAWDDVWAGPLKEGVAGEPYVRWRVEGTEGYALGDIGWPAYPARRVSTLCFASRRLSGWIIRPRWEAVWFPDAFAGTMGELLLALEEGRPPAISGVDHLQTLALAEAVLRSSQEHRVVEVAKVLEEIARHSGRS
jgi:predicted dehydrogenase